MKKIYFSILIVFGFSMFSFGQNDFQKEYDEFIEYQKSPLINAHYEELLLDGTIWQRTYGEREFYLTPQIKNLEEYYQQINTLSKEEKIKFRNTHITEIELNEHSKQVLLLFGINVPDYIIGKINARLSENNIEQLQKEGCIYDILENYGKNLKNFRPQEEESKETIWQEGFESNPVPGAYYSAGDWNNASGNDYWGDLSCESHSGDWSIWCSDYGGQSPCSNYDNDMNSYVEKDAAIVLSGHEDVQFKYYQKYDTEPNPNPVYDYLQLYVYYDDAWNEFGDKFYGNSNGWEQVVHDLPGWWFLRWQFVFHSDGSYSNYEGAYIDDMIVTGNPVVTPTITLEFPNGGEVWAGGTSVDIHWTTENISSSESIKINLCEDNSPNWIIINTPNDGWYVWPISTGFPNDENYKIKISVNSNPTLYDFSDNTFTLMQAPELISPPNNATVYNPVTFSWTPVIGAISYRLFIDGAQITPQNYSNTTFTDNFSIGSHEWKVNAINGLSGTQFSEIKHFYVEAQYITVTSPNGGEVWQAGTSHNITWTDNISENVKIELYKGGAFNSTISSSKTKTEIQKLK